MALKSNLKAFLILYLGMKISKQSWHRIPAGFKTLPSHLRHGAIETIHTLTRMFYYSVALRKLKLNISNQSFQNFD